MRVYAQRKIFERDLMLLGYACVFSDDQHLELQRDALHEAGCERLFKDRQSGARYDRLELRLLLEVALGGDIVVVWRLDRLARSLKDLTAPTEQSEADGIGLRSLRAIRAVAPVSWRSQHREATRA